MIDSYTEEELTALPSTSTVFEAPALEVNAHEWQQQGYMLHDICNPATAACQHMGLPIPSGKLLIKKDGRYDLVDEQRG